MRRVGGPKVHFQFRRQLGEDFFDERAFVHAKVEKLARTGCAVQPFGGYRDGPATAARV
jgi:hypothetical protein